MKLVLFYDQMISDIDLLLLQLFLQFRNANRMAGKYFLKCQIPMLKQQQTLVVITNTG